MSGRIFGDLTVANVASGIVHPEIMSFIGQLYYAEWWSSVKYPNSEMNKSFEKRIIILKDLISKHGEKPCEDHLTICTVHNNFSNKYNPFTGLPSTYKAA